EGYFKKINPRFTEVLGYNLSEIISQKFLDLVHSDDLETIKKEMEKLSDQKTPIHFINRCKTKYNKYRVFDWVVVPDMETNLIYFTARDITDYKSEELDLIHSSKVYSIGEMTSGLSYLINGQLSIIGGHIAFLKAHLEQERVDPIEMKKKIQSIEEAVKRLSKTTRDLSSFARSPENEEVADVPMERIVENVMSLCKEMFRIHSVELDVNIEEGLVIRCRETQIAHVLITLLNSAYNFAHVQRESWVELRAFPKNGMVVITITDSGENKDRTVSGISKGIIEENFGSIHYDLSSPNAKLVIEFPQVQMVR
ncbi:MAG: PAS domain-containing protein, partial [Bacteriovorax sp.]